MCNTFKFIGVNLLNNTTSKLNIYYHNLTIQNHLVNVKKYFRKSKVCMERCFIFFTNSSYKNKKWSFFVRCVNETRESWTQNAFVSTALSIRLRKKLNCQRNRQLFYTNRIYINELKFRLHKLILCKKPTVHKSCRL